MFKILLVLIVAGAILKFTPLGELVWANTIEVINPAAKEARVLGKLETQLAAISDTVKESSFAQLSDSDKVKKITSLVSEASTTLEDAQSIADKSDLLATLNTAVKNILPFSAPACQP